MFALIYTFLYIDDVQKRVLAKPQRSSLRIHMCASERSARASFGVFNSFTVKKGQFLYNKCQILSYLIFKKWGGGDICTGHPPPPRDSRHVHVKIALTRVTDKR